MEEVIVTGMGSICALGNDVEAFWNGLISGKTGIRAITAFSRENLRNVHAGQIEISSDMLEYAERAGIKTRLNLFASLAIEEAVNDSGLSIDKMRQKQSGMVIGTSLGMSLIESTIQYTQEPSPEPGEIAEDLSIFGNELGSRFSIKGDVMVLSTACASGTHVIGLAKDMILLEGYDVVICGSVDTLDRMKYLGHTALNTLTTDMIRPYSVSRSGTLFGEGAAFLVLEREKPISGKSPYAICSGVGYSSDAYHVTTPDPEGRGAVYAMNDALRDACIKPSDVGYINLHGSGTPLNDSVEGQAIETVFGSYSSSIPATSIKAAIGHAMGAAGTLEAVATILSIVNQKVPITLNVDAVSPELKVNLVYKEPLDCSIDYALSNSFGFGGSNGALVFSRTH